MSFFLGVAFGFGGSSSEEELDSAGFEGLIFAGVEIFMGAFFGGSSSELDSELLAGFFADVGLAAFTGVFLGDSSSDESLLESFGVAFFNTNFLATGFGSSSDSLELLAGFAFAGA